MVHEGAGGERLAAASGGLLNLISNAFWNWILEKLRESANEKHRHIWQTGLYFFKGSEAAFHTALVAASTSVELGTDILKIMTGRLHFLKDQLLTQAPASIVNHYRRYQDEDLPEGFEPVSPDPKSFLGELGKLIPKLDLNALVFALDRAARAWKTTTEGVVEVFDPEPFHRLLDRLESEYLARQRAR